MLAAGALVSASSLAQTDAWLPVTAREIGINEVPGSPGAGAIQLYYAQNIDDRSENNEGEYVYERIKILNEQGMDRANVEIRLPYDMKLVDLKARTIHPDGTIVDFAGKLFDKVIVKGKGFKYLAKAFTLPEVNVGSIIEYRYKLDYPANTLPPHLWVVQRDLYTLKEEFRIQAYTGLITGIEGPMGLSLFQNLPRNAKVQKKGEGFELELEDVPGFEAEDYMPPADRYIYHVDLVYGGPEMASPDKFWQTTGLRWNEDAERFIGNSREVRETAVEAAGDDVDPLARLRKIYARAQQVRNLGYERERSGEELKKENLKPNQNAADVLAHGYGDRTDITRLFIALARAAGFDAWVVRAGNRSEKIFDRNLLYSGQLDGEIALVKLNGADFFLEPGTRFCPFGLLRWIRTSTTALKLDKQGGVFVELPRASQDKAVVARTASLALDADGTLRGALTVQYKGAEALERRLDALLTDDAGRKKSLEDEIKSWVPNGSAVQLQDVRGWESSNDPLEAHFTIAAPGYASLAGNRLLVTACLFQNKQKDAFKHRERRFPVYFPYAFSEFDQVNIATPPGFSIESVPADQNAALAYAQYQSVSQYDGARLATRRVLLVNGIFFPTDAYAQVSTFFNKVQQGDEQQAVLQKGGLHEAGNQLGDAGRTTK